MKCKPESFICVIAAAGAWYALQREGSVEQAYWVLSLPAGLLVGEFVFSSCGRKGNELMKKWMMNNRLFHQCRSMNLYTKANRMICLILIIPLALSLCSCLVQKQTGPTVTHGFTLERQVNPPNSFLIRYDGMPAGGFVPYAYEIPERLFSKGEAPDEAIDELWNLIRPGEEDKPDYYSFSVGKYVLDWDNMRYQSYVLSYGWKGDNQIARIHNMFFVDGTCYDIWWFSGAVPQEGKDAMVEYLMESHFEVSDGQNA